MGRYLTNTPNGTLDKAMTFDELEILLAAGLNVFPIFQTQGNKASYFTADQGNADAITAKEAAQNFGFPPSATIYFCVDYDVLMADIENNILPYFRNVKKTLGNAYKIGAYGPRYICTKLSEMNLTTSSFVCDMSTGFTCNIGQKLPANWAYDQFAEIKVAVSEFSGMDYDKCIASTRKTATIPEDFIPSSVGYDNSRIHMNKFSLELDITNRIANSDIAVVLKHYKQNLTMQDTIVECLMVSLLLEQPWQ